MAQTALAQRVRLGRSVATACAALGLAAMGLTVSGSVAHADSYWQLCAYARDGSGNKIGSACSHNNEARVCDTKADGHGIRGTFGIRGVGIDDFADANGSKSPCAYRYYSNTVTSVSAYIGS